MDTGRVTRGPQDTKNPSHKPVKSVVVSSRDHSSMHKELAQTVEIPTLDDMASILVSHEVLERDNTGQFSFAHPKKALEIPEMIMPENEYEEGQSQSTRARHVNRDKSDSSSVFNQFNPEESRKEAEMLFKMAQSLASNGDYEKAVNYYTRIVSLNEKSFPAWIAMGHCYAMLGHDLQALKSYQQALKSNPTCQKDEQLWYGIGLLYQKFEDWNNAENSFRNALKLDPKPALKAEILYNLGTIMKAKGDLPEAIKIFTNAILTNVFPSDKIVEILCQNGILQEKMNDFEGALKTYNYALMLQDGNPKALLCAGWLCFQLEKTEQALGFLKTAAYLLPAEHNISYLIARCHLKLQQHTTAYDCIHGCITKDPNNSTYWSSLGILFCELMQLKQGYESLTKAVKYDAKVPENFFNLGCLFELANQPIDSVKMYDQALELQPSFHLATTRKRRILAKDGKGTLEVQFKHPPFVLPIMREIKKEKPLFNFAQPSQQNIFGDSDMKVIVDKAKAKTISTPTARENIAAPIQTPPHKQKELKPKSRPQNELKEEMLMSNESIQPPLPFSLKSMRLDILAGSLETPKEPIAKVPNRIDSDLSSVKMFRPAVSDPSTKLPPVSSLSGINSFSLNNNHTSVSNFMLKQPTNDGKEPRELNPSSRNASEQSNDSLLPTRAKTDETSSISRGEEFIKQLNGLQAVITKNMQNADGIKQIKSIASPIVLKHDPQMLGSRIIRPQPDILKEARPEAKIVRRLSGEDDDDPVPQKKVKLDMLTKGELP